MLQRPARDYEEINEQLRSKSSIYNNNDNNGGSVEDTIQKENAINNEE